MNHKNLHDTAFIIVIYDFIMGLRFIVSDFIYMVMKVQSAVADEQIQSKGVIFIILQAYRCVHYSLHVHASCCFHGCIGTL